MCLSSSVPFYLRMTLAPRHPPGHVVFTTFLSTPRVTAGYAIFTTFLYIPRVCTRNTILGTFLPTPRFSFPNFLAFLPVIYIDFTLGPFCRVRSQPMKWEYA
ncbi:hypothetical protein DL96DRAFT_1586682 [Flagelloscypha sp. PMI_526]|nr:hypothetical protein DL96DRAFT_1586682 [Flagelloscypha sp. PMI_526]